MLAAIETYLDRVGLPPLAREAREPALRFAARLEAALAAPATPPADDEALLALYRYPVPKLGPGGSCSIAHELEAEPFDLGPLLGVSGLSPEALRAHPHTARLLRLRRVCALLHEETRSDWTGIYRAISLSGPEPAGGEAALCKEAYLGRPSRALFPLTPEFAAHSNNSTAALSRRAVLVADVEAHLAAGRPYYECDAEVRAELCVPVLAAHGDPGCGAGSGTGGATGGARGSDGGGRLLGLIDLESFAAGHYSEGPEARVRTAAAAATAAMLGTSGLLAGTDP